MMNATNVHNIYHLVGPLRHSEFHLVTRSRNYNLLGKTKGTKPRHVACSLPTNLVCQFNQPLPPTHTSLHTHSTPTVKI